MGDVFGEPGGGFRKMSDREKILKLIDSAVKTGARRKSACEAVGISLRTIQRWGKNISEDGRRNNRFSVSNALTAKERKKIIEVACSPEFRSLSPNQIVPILAENGHYFASESTFYRILNSVNLVKHRSRAKAPQRKKPEELKATGPNQVWTWDISYLRTLVHGCYLYLYLILDIWDRSVVGWAVHESESGYHAAELLRKTCLKHQVEPGSIKVHQDNGGPMISSEFLSELQHWGQPSYSRPGICDDNPYSESMFRTLKYRPGFPGAFENIEEARNWMCEYVQWYNHEHRHSRIGFVTPMQRRQGEDKNIMEKRIKTYKAAKQAHPERWSGKIRNWKVVQEVTLNPRKSKKDRQEKAA